MLKKSVSLIWSVVNFLLCGWRKHGAVCFTFDDFGGDNWVKADEIFKKYDAHATFLVSGNLTDKHIEVMAKLQQAGHTVGLHSVGHANAVSQTQEFTPETYFQQQIKPQLDICGANNIKVAAFAYPNNLHNEEFDKYLFQYFDFLRAGVGSDKKPVFVPVKQLKRKIVLQGKGIGKFYNSDLNELKKLLDHAADTNSMIAFFSHDIFPDAPRIHMPNEWLEELLKHASERKMRIIGADEIKGCVIKDD